MGQPNGITPTPDDVRFWAKVDRSGGPDACWPWTAAKERRGYGVFVFGGKTRLAPRIAYELTYGPIPNLRGQLGYHGLCVLHRCDTPACCNPAHLRVGTHIDNMVDRDAKGRTHRVPRKLRADVEAMVVRLYRSGNFSATRLAAIYGVSANTVYRMVNRATAPAADGRGGDGT